MDNKLNTLHQLVKTQDDNISLLNAKFKALHEVLLKHNFEMFSDYQKFLFSEIQKTMPHIAEKISHDLKK